MNRFGVCVAALAAGLSMVSALPRAARAAGSIPPYTLVGSFPLSASAWDITADGRVMRIVGDTLSVQDAPNAPTYSPIGSVAPGLVSPFGASFLRIAPDGFRVAIGDNNFGPGASVLIANTASALPGPVPTVSIASPNTDAAWADNQTLYVSGYGSGSELNRLDTAALTSQTVISGIGEGSGGVAIRAGLLYTGIGFDFGAATGDIRAFSLAALASAAAPVAFSTGTFTTNALSASSLGFDPFGNLLVGGGDFFSGSPDFGYATVIDTASPLQARLQLSPAGPSAFYGIRFNTATDELLVVADGTAYRYAIPAPGAAVALAFLVPLAARRRRTPRTPRTGGVSC
ncbi:MAG: hypothetical protein ACKVS8_08400 [Phycisphaerales bacterium]